MSADAPPVHGRLPGPVCRSPSLLGACCSSDGDGVEEAADPRGGPDAAKGARRDLGGLGSTSPPTTCPTVAGVTSPRARARTPRRPSRARVRLSSRASRPSDVEIVSVDGTVYAKSLGGFPRLRPRPLRAPDPAVLLDPDTGFARILTEAERRQRGRAGARRRRQRRDPHLLHRHRARQGGQNILPCAPGDSSTPCFTSRRRRPAQRRHHRRSSSTTTTT